MMLSLLGRRAATPPRTSSLLARRSLVLQAAAGAGVCRRSALPLPQQRNSSTTTGESPYVFRASQLPLVETPGLAYKEAHMLDGVSLRYQVRSPGPNTGLWCLTGHSVFVVGGELTYEFADHTTVLTKGDMAHIPAGKEHKHRPSVVGDEPCYYFLTEFE